jgi:hypothetical protein
MENEHRHGQGRVTKFGRANVCCGIEFNPQRRFEKLRGSVLVVLEITVVGTPLLLVVEVEECVLVRLGLGLVNRGRRREGLDQAPTDLFNANKIGRYTYKTPTPKKLIVLPRASRAPYVRRRLSSASSSVWLYMRSTTIDISISNLVIERLRAARPVKLVAHLDKKYM